MASIVIEAGGITLTAELLETPTAAAIRGALPLEGKANVWGEEIYFDIPVHVELEEDAREVVEVGDLAFWPVGDAFCIFFGPTPVSEGDEPRAYSPVNVFGHVRGDAKALTAVSDGARVTVTAA
jgi:hypothetical protein